MLPSKIQSEPNPFSSLRRPPPRPKHPCLPSWGSWSRLLTGLPAAVLAHPTAARTAPPNSVHHSSVAPNPAVAPILLARKPKGAQSAFSPIPPSTPSAQPHWPPSCSFDIPGPVLYLLLPLLLPSIAVSFTSSTLSGLCSHANRPTSNGTPSSELPHASFLLNCFP